MLLRPWRTTLCQTSNGTSCSRYTHTDIRQLHSSAAATTPLTTVCLHQFINQCARHEHPDYREVRHRPPPLGMPQRILTLLPFVSLSWPCFCSRSSLKSWVATCSLSLVPSKSSLQTVPLQRPAKARPTSQHSHTTPCFASHTTTGMKDPQSAKVRYGSLRALARLMRTLSTKEQAKAFQDLILPMLVVTQEVTQHRPAPRSVTPYPHPCHPPTQRAGTQERRR